MSRSRLDRKLQIEILEKLAQQYPERAIGKRPMDLNAPKAQFNAFYLEEHGLSNLVPIQTIGESKTIHSAIITAKGLDFLEEDGGLWEAYRVVPIRFEAETLRSLISTKVDKSSLPANEKTKIRHKLNELGSDALKKVVEKGLDAAFHQSADWLKTLLSS